MPQNLTLLVLNLMGELKGEGGQQRENQTKQALYLRNAVAVALPCDIPSRCIQFEHGW